MEKPHHKTSPLLQHASVLAELLASWTNLSNHDVVAAFILAALALRTKSKWSVGPRKTPRCSNTTGTTTGHTSTTLLKDIPHLLDVLKITPTSNVLKWCNTTAPTELSLRSIFLHIRLRGLKPSTNAAMVGWCDGQRPLVLLHHIPSPNEVLKQQAHGNRVCTLFLQPEQLSSLHVSPLAYMDGNHNHARDALDFLVHDLSHIELFCESTTYLEQIGFFNCIHSLDPTHMGKPYRFFKTFANMKVLWPQFQYVFSDMNCHSTHLLAYLKAKWLMHDEQRMLLLGKRTTAESATEVATEETAEVKDTEGPREKMGFREGWPLMMATMGMEGIALEGANLLCGGTKMTMLHGEAIRDFFRARGRQVLDDKTEGKSSSTRVTQDKKTESEQKKKTEEHVPMAPSSPSALLPPPMTVTEKIAQQVNAIRAKRIHEVQEKAMAMKQAQQQTLTLDKDFIRQQEIHYNAIVGDSFSLKHRYV